MNVLTKILYFLLVFINTFTLLSKDIKPKINNHSTLNDSLVTAYKLDGTSYYNGGNYYKAIESFTRVIEIDKTDFISLNNRGLCYYNIKKFDLAIKDFTSSIKIDSLFSPAYNNRGIVKYNNQNIAKASISDLKSCEDDFSKAIVLDSTLKNVYRNRGVIRYYLRDYKNAQIDLVNSLKYNENDVIALLYAGKSFDQNDKSTEALPYFNKLLKVANFLSQNYVERAKCYINIANYESALQDLTTAKKQVDPNMKEIEFITAKLFAAQKNKKSMLEHLKKAEKYGLFGDRETYTILLKDKSFKNFNNDKDLIEYIQKVKFK
jgi:tetratricopeptide (TPR) repeat protein